MAKLRELLDSPNILEELLSFDDKTLCSYFKELSNLDFHLNSHGMHSKHKFTVIDHTKRLLKNFSLAMKYKDNPELFNTELIAGTSYKKDFFKRSIQLITEMELKPDSDDFKVIVLTLLLHDVGKGSYDKTDAEILEQARGSRKKGRNHSVDYFTLLYKMKDHEERGASIIYSLLEETRGVSQAFAKRLKNLILGHGDFSKLQTEKDFNFYIFLRRIIDYASEYNYPFIQQDSPEVLLIHELNINYLVFLIDIYSVDDTGKVWYSVKQEKETVYLRAKWYLGKKLEDLLAIINERYPAWEESKRKNIVKVLKRNFFKSLRANSSFQLESSLIDICTSEEKKKLIDFIKEYFNHTSKMFALYLNNTTPYEKYLHIKMLQSSDGRLIYHIAPNHNSITINLVKKYAPEGSLLKIVQSIIYSSIECNRTMKILQLHAYSGEDGRLVDIAKVNHIHNKEFTEEMQNVLRKNLDKLNDPGYKIKQLDLPITKEELEERIESINVELHEVEIGSRKFQVLQIKTSRLSNLTLYSCLNSLSFFNIIDMNVEALDSYYQYSFLLSARQSYKITSTSAFKQDLIEELNKNVVVTA